MTNEQFDAIMAQFDVVLDALATSATSTLIAIASVNDTLAHMHEQHDKHKSNDTDHDHEWPLP